MNTELGEGRGGGSKKSYCKRFRQTNDKSGFQKIHGKCKKKLRYQTCNSRKRKKLFGI